MKKTVLTVAATAFAVVLGLYALCPTCVGFAGYVAMCKAADLILGERC